MWKTTFDAYLSIRANVFAYAQKIVDIFSRTLSNILDSVDEDFADFIEFVVPESIMSLTLLELMTGVFVPVLLVIWIVKLFI